MSSIPPVVKLKAVPKWMPDSTLDACPYCKYEFGFFFRRHHCRICGGLVCADCSQSSWVLSLLGTSPQRVCDYCDKAVRSVRDGEEFDELDEHVVKISEFLPFKFKQKEVENESKNQQNGQKSVTVDQQDDEIPEQDSSVVIGSVQSTSSVAVITNDNDDDDDTIVTLNTAPNHSQNGPKSKQNVSFMSDLINTPDAPAPAPTPTNKPQQPNPQTPTKILAPSRQQHITNDSATLSTQNLSVSIEDTTSTTPSSSALTTPTADRGVVVSTNACETPSGRKAQLRAQHGSLKRSLTRPTQHGAQVTTLQSQGANKLRTLKRNQMETLIKQAQVAAVVQELDIKKTGTSTDDVDVGSFLGPRSGSIITDQDGNEIAPQVASIDEDSQVVVKNDDDVVIANEEKGEEKLSPTSSSSSSSSSKPAYPTHNITQSGRYTLVDLFNSLWSKSSPIVVDTRDIIRFNISHVPFSLHIPITPDDIDFEKNELKTTLSVLASRIPNANDQRAWRMRKGRAIVIVGQGPFDQDITAQKEVNIESLLRIGGQLPPDEDKATTTIAQNDKNPGALPKVGEMINEYDTTPHYVPALFASACIKENAANSVDIVSLGAQAFIDRYPFLMCSSMNARHATLSIPKLEQPDQKHQHISRFPAYPNEIIDQCVFLGSQADSEQKGQLEKLGITHIINATADLPNAFEDQKIELTDPSTQNVITQPLFSYLRLSMNDTHDQPLLEQLNIAFDFIDKALAGENLAGANITPGTAGKVLVHCQMGISRSASIIVAYVMRSFNCDLYNALAMVKSRRSQVLPNPTFVLELAKYECLLFNYPMEKSSYKKCIDELYPNGIPTPKA